jgi:proliferating cell nuclear antigen
MRKRGLLLFNIKMVNARLLRGMITAISTLIDEAIFDLSPSGIKLRAMDPSRVAMVDFEWPKIVFDEYTCDDNMKMCINIGELLRLLRRAGTNDSAELNLDQDNGRLKITIRGKYLRTFNMPTLEVIEEEVPIPRLSFLAKAEITTEGLRQAFEDVSLVSDHVQIDVSSEKMKMRALGDFLGADIELKVEDDSLLSLEVKEPSKATYSLSYLSEIVKAASSTSEIASIEFSTDMPIRLNFAQQQEGKLTFYLAPRIEVE